MQTALLLFIVVISLAIGFFLGLLLLSMNSPLAKKITRTQTETDPSAQDAEKTEPPPTPEPPPPASALDTHKPTPNSKLVLTVWQEEGQPPIYEREGVYFEKKDLPRQLLHVITIKKEAVPQQAADEQQASPSPTLEDKVEDDGELLSVINEIDKILQKMLADSPLSERGIHLMENQNQEIRIWVGLESYDMIEDIPDADVRAIINSAVKEWEDRSA
jgi:hypothetical protein